VTSPEPGRFKGAEVAPVNLLTEQTYDGHNSIHDSALAAKLGFSEAPIEGPTHFAGLEPLLVAALGKDWLSKACLSVHFIAPVFAGERTVAEVVRESSTRATVTVTKASCGTPVLSGSATTVDDDPEVPTEVDSRIAAFRPPSQPLVILADVEVGDVVYSEHDAVVMLGGGPIGDLYPFSLERKLETTTAPSPFYAGEDVPPWPGQPILPLEMIPPLSLLGGGRLKQREPVVGMFTDVEIQLTGMPIFAGQRCRVIREVLALTASPRAEVMAVRNHLFDVSTGEAVAQVTINIAHLVQSYPTYEAELKLKELS